MAALTKKLCKDLAVQLAGLRPLKGTDSEHELWLEMCRKVADGAVPHNLADAFVSACTNHGAWISEYEE